MIIISEAKIIKNLPEKMRIKIVKLNDNHAHIIRLPLYVLAFDFLPFVSPYHRLAIQAGMVMSQTKCGE